MDRQLKQTALPCRLSGEHIGTHYGAPDAKRPLPDVQRRVDVGLGFVPAADTFEGGLVGPVFLVDAATGAAFARGVAGIDEGHGNTDTLALVDHKGAKLPKSPITKPRSLVAASGRNPAADTLQILQGQSASGAFSIQYERLRNHMVRMFLVSPLSGCQLAEPSFCALRAALLQATTALLDMAPLLLNIGASIDRAIAIDGQGDNAEVNAKPVFGPELRSFGNVASSGQHPLPAHEAQIGFALLECEQLALMLTHHDRNGDAAFQGPDADGSTVFDESEDAVIVRLCGILAENRRNIAIDLERIGDLRDRPHRYLSGQTKPLPDISVSQFVEIELPEGIGLVAYACQPRRRLIATGQRRLQGKSLRLRRDQLNGGYQLHSLKYGVVFHSRQARGAARPALSLRCLKAAVSRGGSL